MSVVLGVFIAVANSISPALHAQTTPPPVYRWTTLAGRASVGAEDGSLTEARFAHPHGLARDALGNLYVADTGNHTIRKITPAGIVSTFAGSTGIAGSADGAGTAARFNRPESVGVDANGNVYVADTGNHTIRLITPAGVVSTLAGQSGTPGYADGPAASARFDSPNGLIVAPDGTIFLENHGRRKIAGGQVTAVQIPETARAADGSSVRVSLGSFAADANGRLYFRGEVSDVHFSVNACIVRLEADGTLTLWWFPREFSTLGWSARTIFNDVFGNLYLTHNYPGIGGTPGFREGWAYQPATNALTQRTVFVGAFGEMDEVRGIAVDAQTGNWFYTRASDSAIVGTNGAAFAGSRAGSFIDGPALNARFVEATSMAVDRNNSIWIADHLKLFPRLEPPDAASLRKLNANGTVSTVINQRGFTDFSKSYLSTTSDTVGRAYLSYYNGPDPEMFRVESDGSFTRLPVSFLDSYQQITAIASTSNGIIYGITNFGKIYRYEASGQWSLIGGGESPPGLGFAKAICADSLDNLYVLDGSAIWQISPAGAVTKLIADVSLKLSVDNESCDPTAIAVDSQQTVYLSYRSKTLSRTDSAGWSRSYAYDVNTLRRITRGGEDSIIGSSEGYNGSKDGLTGVAQFARPSALAVDRDDNLYVIDDEGRTIRKAVFVGRAPALTRQPASTTVSVGASATFIVEAAAGATPSYQWYFNGTLISGATGSSLTISPARSADAGEYSVVVTNDLGSATSNRATLTVNAATLPSPTGPSGGGGGGGGAPSLGVAALLAMLLTLRARRG